MNDIRQNTSLIKEKCLTSRVLFFNANRISM